MKGFVVEQSGRTSFDLQVTAIIAAEVILGLTLAEVCFFSYFYCYWPLVRSSPGCKKRLSSNPQGLPSSKANCNP